MFHVSGISHRNSKGDGKGGDDVSAESTPKLTVNSPSRKGEHTTVYKLQERKSPETEIHVIIGMFPMCAKKKKNKAYGDANFGDKCAYKHTAKPADERKNLASIAIHIPSNDERQMQWFSKGKHQYQRVRVIW